MEIHSLVLMDVILVLALQEMSLAQKIHVIKQLAHTKAKLILMEIHSLVLMAVIHVLALQEMSLVQIIHANQLLAELTLTVHLAIIVPKNPVMINKVLAV
jgi:hypothetical protein